MLTLSRKIGESVVIPELGITFVLQKQKGNRFYVGIDAPRELTVLRGELQAFDKEDDCERAA